MNLCFSGLTAHSLLPDLQTKIVRQKVLVALQLRAAPPGILPRAQNEPLPARGSSTVMPCTSLLIADTVIITKAY